MAGRPHRPVPARKALIYRHAPQPPANSTCPIDTVRQYLQHRDSQRSRLLPAMESKTASSIQTMPSVAAHFQMQIGQAQRNHQFRSSEAPSKQTKARKAPDLEGFFAKWLACTTATSICHVASPQARKPASTCASVIRKVLRRPLHLAPQGRQRVHCLRPRRRDRVGWRRTLLR